LSLVNRGKGAWMVLAFVAGPVGAVAVLVAERVLAAVWGQ